MNKAKLYETITIAFIYFGLAKLGLSLDFQDTNVTPVWPPAGFAVACVLLRGYNSIAGIFIGAALANLVSFSTHLDLSINTLFMSLGIAASNSLEAFIVGKFILRTASKNKILRSYLSVTTFFISALLASLLAATIGSLILWNGSVIDLNLVKTVAITWWLGDLTGILTITPVFIFFLTPGRKEYTIQRGVIDILSGGIILTVCFFALFDTVEFQLLSQKELLLYLALLFIALRMSFKLSSVMIVVISFMAITATLLNQGPFIFIDKNDSLIAVQSFASIISISFLSLQVAHNTRHDKSIWDKLFRGQLLTVLIGCSSFYATVIISINFHQREESNKNRIFQNNISHLVDLMNKDDLIRVSAMKRMQERWYYSGNPEMKLDAFKNDALNLIRDYPGFQAITKINEEYQITHIIPFLNNEEAIGLELSQIPDVKTLLDHAKATGQGVSTTPRMLAQGGLGLIYYYPIKNKDNKFTGFISSVFNTQKWIEHILDKENIIADIEIKYHDQLLYTTLEAPNKPNTESALSREFKFVNLDCQIDYYPKSKMIDDLSSHFPTVAGILGFLLSALMTSATAMALTSFSRLKTTQHQARELKKTNQELRNFTYLVSHDLKAPVANLKGFTEELNLLIDEHKYLIKQHVQNKESIEILNNFIDTEFSECTHLMDISTQRLDNFITQLLKISKAGAHQIELENINTYSLVLKIIDSFEHQIKKENISIEVKDLPSIVSDPFCMEHTFANLISNAIKYQDPDRDGKYIKIWGTTNIDGTKTYHVQDNGRGIAEKDCAQVFTPFRRLGEQNTEGEGIGLNYIQVLLRQIDGSISFTSQAGDGTTFYFTLQDK